MIVTVGKNGAIPLDINEELTDDAKFRLGDILLCTLSEDKKTFTLELHEDQSLTDEEIAEHGNLCVVEKYNPADFDFDSE